MAMVPTMDENETFRCVCVCVCMWNCVFVYVAAEVGGLGSVNKGGMRTRWEEGLAGNNNNNNINHTDTHTQIHTHKKHTHTHTHTHKTSTKSYKGPYTLTVIPQNCFKASPFYRALIDLSFGSSLSLHEQTRAQWRPCSHEQPPGF